MTRRGLLGLVATLLPAAAEARPPRRWPRRRYNAHDAARRRAAIHRERSRYLRDRGLAP